MGNKPLTLFNMTLAIFSSLSLMATTSASAPFPYVISAEDPSSSNTPPPPFVEEPPPVTSDEEEDMAPPDEEDETNVEQDGSNPNSAAQRVLYDPKMIYGKGSPTYKVEPFSTTKKNLIAFGTSVILGTIAMLVVSSNKGSDAPNTSKP